MYLASVLLQGELDQVVLLEGGVVVEQDVVPELARQTVVINVEVRGVVQLVLLHLQVGVPHLHYLGQKLVIHEEAAAGVLHLHFNNALLVLPILLLDVEGLLEGLTLLANQEVRNKQ